MNNSLTYYIVMSVSLMFVMFLSSQVIYNIGLEEGITPAYNLFNYDDSHIKQSDTTGNFTLDDDVLGALPSGSGTLGADDASGNIFTDTFKVVKNWLYETAGIKYVVGVLNIVPNFMKSLFPAEMASIAFALGYLWIVLATVALVFWLRGGSN